jgi:hypothetical protein
MNNQEKELAREINSLLNDEPSKVALNISNTEKINIKRMHTDFGNFVKQFEHFFDLLVTLFDQVNYIKKDSWPKQKTVQFIAISHNLQTLYCSFDLLVRGHHAESITLIRSVYETFVKIIYMSCYPKDCYSVFYKKRDGTKEFNLTNFLSQDLKLNRDSIYIVMSSIAHGKNYQIMKDIKQITMEGQKNKIGLNIKYDKKTLEIAINYLYFLLWMFIKITIELFIQKNTNQVNKDLLEKSIKNEKVIEKIFIGHPGKEWKTINTDVAYIFKIVESAENKQNWKNLVQKQT